MLAPLKPYRSLDGQSYSYYDCQEILDVISREGIDKKRILVVVDGPPGSTGKHARHPALEIVTEVFKTAEIDVLLDDCNRQDEKEITEFWTKIIEKKYDLLGIQSNRFEKGAVLLKLKK